jgi:DNA-binding GntR family transcriptional regulator
MTALPATPVSSKTLAETIRDDLIRLIITGALKPGDRLNEAHLSQAFGTSRGPVREAAQELIGLGFVASKVRVGFFVATLTPAEIIDLYEAKPWMDRALINDLVKYADVETLRTIRADIESIDASSRPRFGQTLFEFRSRMVGQLHNRFLAEQLLALYRKFYLITGLVSIRIDDEDARVARIIGTLRGFFDALIEGDADRATEVADADTAYWLKDIAPRFAERKIVS